MSTIEAAKREALEVDQIWGEEQYTGPMPTPADIEQLRTEVQQGQPPAVKLTRASDVHCRPIGWLWPGWLAAGKLHIFGGHPGCGKTTAALSIAAIVSNGGLWPDGSRAPIGNVLIWSGEDDAADTLVPRLMAAGADLNRVYIVGDVVSCGEPRPFNPAADILTLEKQAEAIGGVRLLIADPVVSAVTGDSHKNAEVRRALQPIVNLASRLGCAVLGITHFSKGTAGRDPTERITGSIAFGALARVVIVATKGEDGDRIIARAKSNIGPDGGGFQYDLEQVELDGLSASRVVWGDVIEGTAREIIGETEVGSSSRDDALTWLEELLWSGPVPVKAIKQEATASGTSWRTVERAKKELGVEAHRVQDGAERGRGHWEWMLPGKTANSKTASPTSKSGGLKESQYSQGFQGDSGFNTASSQSGGVKADLNKTCPSCAGEGCGHCGGDS
ncbi:AAA family ATPase [Microbulbifer sp. CAU 1566]|uniref:AAA family ATPase n=1 Tax=Microbulbifer sp. CAU 1566 TaxID=2933269 RepID=UPI0020029DD5|nr:AAA family ATPase [Microbulbifer sp. CAU 1566]MCK7597791.1 AAA family ATPase [Microbulbifer sp. CAU 1566]